MVRRVTGGMAYTAVADWLNDEGVAPGPYVVKGVWTGKLVEDLLRDPILHGTRTFGDWLGRTVYSTGRHKRRKNPEGPATEHYDELAHLSEEEHQALLRVMSERADVHRHAAGPGHPLYNRPRSRSVWPGQHPRCAACGELMYRYDNDQLKCRGSFKARAEGPCWNHVQVACQEIRDRVLSGLVGHCEQFPAFRGALADAAWAELQAWEQRQGRRSRVADDEVVTLEKRAANLTRAIEMGGISTRWSASWPAWKRPWTPPGCVGRNGHRPPPDARPGGRATRWNGSWGRRCGRSARTSYRVRRPDAEGHPRVRDRAGAGARQRPRAAPRKADVAVVGAGGRDGQPQFRSRPRGMSP